jgi:riboflavin transporter FmnP
MKRKINVKMLVTLGMFCAIAYALMFLSRFTPAIAAGFLKYDPKDIVIAISGFIYGPAAALAVSVVVAFLEFVTVSTTGWIGMIMNILASGVFACTASLIYKKKHTLKGAVLGLVFACVLTTGIMVLWNYIMTPIYMGYPRAMIAKMLVPVFLPFNFVKTVANASFTIMLYKPLVNALRKAHLIDLSSSTQQKGKNNRFLVYALAILAILSCVLIVLVINDII